MKENALNVVDAIALAINNKVSNLIIASSVAVAGQVSDKISQPQFKPLSEIPITHIFSEPQSAGNIITMIGCLWIMLQILNLCGAFKLIGWVWEKFRARKN